MHPDIVIEVESSAREPIGADERSAKPGTVWVGVYLTPIVD